MLTHSALAVGILGAVIAGDAFGVTIPRCATPTRLRHPSPAVGAAARAGPLYFVTGAAGPRAVVELVADNPRTIRPTKVLVYVRRPLRAVVELEGYRCADAKPLHFWYRPCCDLPEAGSAEELEQMGDRVATLAPGEPPITFPALGYPGYMLFSHPGNWKVFVRRGHRLLGSAVFTVVPGSSPSGAFLDAAGGRVVSLCYQLPCRRGPEP